MMNQKEVMSKALTKFFKEDTLRDFCKFLKVFSDNPLDSILQKFDVLTGKKDLLISIAEFLVSNVDMTPENKVELDFFLCIFNEELGFPIPKLTVENLTLDYFDSVYRKLKTKNKDRLWDQPRGRSN